jgi:uncharacterized membrane protein YbhN (UPF0104 family)
MGSRTISITVWPAISLAASLKFWEYVYRLLRVIHTPQGWRPAELLLAMILMTIIVWGWLLYDSRETIPRRRWSDNQ